MQSNKMPKFSHCRSQQNCKQQIRFFSPCFIIRSPLMINTKILWGHSLSSIIGEHFNNRNKVVTVLRQLKLFYNGLYTDTFKSMKQASVRSFMFIAVYSTVNLLNSWFTFPGSKIDFPVPPSETLTKFCLWGFRKLIKIS